MPVLRMPLTLVAGFLYALGLTAGLIVRCLVWCWSATAVGWDAALGHSTPVDAPLRRVA